LNKTPITEVQPNNGITYYVDLRSYGYAWYKTLNLPDADHIIYCLPYIYIAWANRSHTKIIARCTLLREEFTVNHHFIVTYGMVTVLKPNMKLINKALCIEFPSILPHTTRSQLLRQFSSE
jgi:hypothetical protein